MDLTINESYEGINQIGKTLNTEEKMQLKIAIMNLKETMDFE